MKLCHIIQAQQFSPEILEELFTQADEMEELIKSKNRIAVLREKEWPVFSINLQAEPELPLK